MGNPVMHERGEFLVSTDPRLLDLDAIHAALTRQYWSEGIPRQTVERALAHSLCFGLYRGREQIGLARVISDCATFAYLCDVYVLQAFRGRGLSKWLMECMVTHPELQGLRVFCLRTRDAHGLYRRYGFEPLTAPDRWLSKDDPTVYKQPQAGGGR